MALGDDSASLVQLSGGVQYSQGQRILAALAKEGSTICVEAAAGDVAPVAGSYTAKMSQQAVEVVAGSVAPQTGSFCVPKQDVLLMQRTHGLNTARDFETALGKKNEQTTTTMTTTMTTTTTTATTMDSAKVNFNEPHDLVTVPWCPGQRPFLLQGLDATVARKDPSISTTSPIPSAPDPYASLGDDERRVCECRSFLRSSAAKIGPRTFEDIGKLVAAPPTQLLQRNLDAALASKKPETTTTSTTTTSTTTIFAYSTNLTTIDERVEMGCNTAAELSLHMGNYTMGLNSSWAVAAKLLNDPTVASQVFEPADITEGWQHCDQWWVVRGACGRYR